MNKVHEIEPRKMQLTDDYKSIENRLKLEQNFTLGEALTILQERAQ